MKRRLFGEAHPDTALTACNYAALLCDLDRRAEARELCAYALATFEQTLDPQHPRIAGAKEIWNRCTGTWDEHSAESHVGAHRTASP
jgi:hypothetical protein